MKVLLVVPTFAYGDNPAKLLSLSDFPTGLAYIAAALAQAGHEVRGLNPNNALAPTQPYYHLANKLSAALQEFPLTWWGLAGYALTLPSSKTL